MEVNGQIHAPAALFQEITSTDMEILLINDGQ
jgi:hypothetical protein